MKRSAPPRRRSSIARTAITGKRARIRRNSSRQAKNLERAHGPAARREWMKRQPCVVCGRTPCDAAHLKCGGVGRKDDASRTVPLCSDYPDRGCLKLGHHSEYDGGKKTFAAKYPHLNLPALAAETDHRFTREHAA